MRFEQPLFQTIQRPEGPPKERDPCVSADDVSHINIGCSKETGIPFSDESEEVWRTSLKLLIPHFQRRSI